MIYINIIKFNTIFPNESIEIMTQFAHNYNITIWSNEKLVAISEKSLEILIQFTINKKNDTKKKYYSILIA